MPLSIGQALAKTAAAAPSLLSWQVVVAYIIPFAILITAVVSFYFWVRSKQYVNRVFYLHKDGILEGIDAKLGAPSFKMGDTDEHNFAKDGTSIRWKTRLFGLQPAHIFVEGIVNEIELLRNTPETKAASSKYAKEMHESRLYNVLARGKADLGFMFVLALAAFLGGSIIGAVGYYMLTKAPAKKG